MSITGDDQHSRRLETVASISDNEAEFWTVGIDCVFC